jgi:ABC-2 type transport system permease protein
VKALTIAANAIRRLIRDRSNIFFVFLLPIGIIVIIGSIFGGGFVPSIGLVVEEPGVFADRVAVELEAGAGMTIVRFDDAGVMLVAVERGDVVAGVRIPAGFDADLAAGSNVDVGFVARPDGDGFRLRSLVGAAVSEQAATLRAARFASGRGVGSMEDMIAVAEGVSVGEIGVVGATVGEAEFVDLGRFDLGAASQLVLFMYLTGLTGSAALIEARRLGLSRRMLATPTPASTIILGEGLGRYGVVLVQGIYIVAVTLIVFGVDWGDPVGAAAIVLLFGAACAGAAMLMGTLFENDQQAGGVGVIAGLGFAALGGCMVPIEFFPPTMQTIAHLTPHAWALDGFAELVRRDGTVVDILPELGMLALFAVGLIGIASWRLRRSITAA